MSSMSLTAWRAGLSLLVFVGSGACLHACSGTGTDSASKPAAASGAGGEGQGAGGDAGAGGGVPLGGSGGGLNVGGGSQSQNDPTTCAEASLAGSYLGCEFWPTILDNPVRPIFDYVVVAANAGSSEAEVTVDRGGNPIGTVKVPPGGLVKMFLPWIEELKSTQTIIEGCPTNVKTSTVHAKQGAYHVVSTRPIALYQFNALEYEGKGGPPGKDWSTCDPGDCLGVAGGCFSYSNDASLLLPAAALSGTYRIAGAPSWKNSDPGDPMNPEGGFTYPAYFSVTATQDSTKVTVQLSSTAAIAGGGGLPDIPPGGTANFTLNRGDVALLVAKGDDADFSGTLVKADKAVQVLTGISCTQMPHGQVACDHLEESVLPAETLGKRYFVTAPSGPAGKMLGHVVRFYGNVDGTKLTYPGANPGGPLTLNAGEVVELPKNSTDFEVVGDHEFTVASFQVGAGPVGDLNLGDPAQTFAVTVEQYRVKYVFLTPDDYDESYADIVQPLDAKLSLDGVPVNEAPQPLSSGFGVVRLKLGPGQGGAHLLTASAPVGLQVMGYGAYTSYQYPGGLNLGFISPAPIK